MRIEWHLDEFERIRKSPGMVAYLTEMGEQLVGELNAELHAAQEARGQEVEDGYKFYISNPGSSSRARLHIVAFTARGIAHEAAHQSILRKLGQAHAEVERARRQDRERARRVRRAYDMTDPFGRGGD